MSSEVLNEINKVPKNKIKCFITGKLRENTDEEKVRQSFAKELVQVYGYLKEDMDINFKIKMGSSKKFADIVIFYHGMKHLQENIKVIIEAKKVDVNSSDKKEGVEQLKSYCSASIKCQYGIWVGNEKIIYKISKEKDFIKSLTIPHYNEQKYKNPSISDLKPAIDLKQTFKRIHNYIYANQGLHKDVAFEELQKIIFVKMYDEQYNPDLKFYINPDEENYEFKQRIFEIFDDVKLKYNHIFDERESIKLNDYVLAYIISELQIYSLLNTNVDIKGEAYETIVGSNLRGDKGEFFTPRNVSKLLASMVLSLVDEKKVLTPGKIKILDPALGTGGFLISIIMTLKELMNEKKFDKNLILTNIKDISALNLFGIDFNPFLVKVAQMNMVMHGDGSSNIFMANSLEKKENWNENVQKNIQFGDFDIVITNPPFGSKAKIHETHILEQYELISFDKDKERTALPPEQLFIERCLDFLKPGGILGIVLPNSILSNPGLEWLRKYILEKTIIIASVDLPKETFQPHTGTHTALLILKKKTDVDVKINENYEIFMALPKKVGRNQRGETLFKTNLNGEHVLNEYDEKIIDDSLPNVEKEFLLWNQKG